MEDTEHFKKPFAAFGCIGNTQLFPDTGQLYSQRSVTDCIISEAVVQGKVNPFMKIRSNYRMPLTQEKCKV